MSEEKVEFEYIIKRRDASATYSICYSPEVAIVKLRRARVEFPQHEFIVVRKTTTTQEVFLG